MRARHQPGGGERRVEPFDLTVEPLANPLRLVEVAGAPGLLECRGRLPSRRRADRRDGAFQAVRGQPQRFAVALLQRADRCVAATADNPSGRCLMTSLSSWRSPPEYASAARSSNTRSVTCAVRGPPGSAGAAAAESLDGRDQLVDVDRLREVAVHAGGQAAFAIALHGVRGERDERQPPARRAFSRSRIACAASKPPISGICRSISTTSNGALADRVDRLDRLAAVLDGLDDVAALAAAAW